MLLFLKIISKDYLALAISSLESHIYLLGIKYLEWRTKLYVELSHVYEELGSINPALRTIEICLAKVYIKF